MSYNNQKVMTGSPPLRARHDKRTSILLTSWRAFQVPDLKGTLPTYIKLYINYYDIIDGCSLTLNTLRGRDLIYVLRLQYRFVFYFCLGNLKMMIMILLDCWSILVVIHRKVASVIWINLYRCRIDGLKLVTTAMSCF